MKRSWVLSVTLLTLILMLSIAGDGSVLSAGPSETAATSDNPEAVSPLTGALEALHAAVSAGEPKAILGARATLAMLLAETPGDASLHYWTAFADWRVVPLLQRDDKKAAQRQCEAGLAAAEKAMKLDPTHAEAVAIHAGLSGLSLAFKNPMAGMTLGPKMEEAIQKANALGPDNPRVVLIEAINTIHKPAFVGGGAKKAMPLLEKARDAFAKEPMTAENWGHDDVYIWLGRAAMSEKDYAAARTWLQKAREVNPENRWVGDVLLPKVEAELAKQAG